MNTNLLSSLFIGEILPSKLDLLDLKKKKNLDGVNLYN